LWVSGRNHRKVIAIQTQHAPAAAQSSSRTAGRLIAETLRDCGVQLAFGLPGIHNMGLWPCLGECGIRVIGSRHEQGTVYAADGYARATGRVGVALTTTGPGAANTVGAIGEAWASKVPVVLIATDIPGTLRRAGTYRGVVHECVDQPGLFRPVTKQQFICRDPDGAGETIADAIAAASEPPAGPIYVEFPADLFDQPASNPPATPRLKLAPAPAPDSDSVQAAAALIEGARRPLVWAGGGARNAARALEEFATALGAPVITTFQARGVLPPKHPLLVGLPPHEPAVTELIEQADLVVVVGSDLDQMMTQAWRLPLPQPRIAINIDPADAAKNYPIDVTLATESATGLEALTPGGYRERWFKDLRGLEQQAWAQIKTDPDTSEAAEYVEALRRAIPEHAVVFCDMAVPGYWGSAYLPVARERGLHYPMGWGTLGYALPASIGAAAANTAPVVSLNGDGGALFALGELATIAQEQLPLTIVIVDDSGYGMLRYGKDTTANRYGTELLAPDFAAIARGFGLHASATIGVGREFETALVEGIESMKPNLIVTQAKLTPPFTTSPRWPLAHP
jgi:thiamine pyrophosphate-dependent acetolactate synthase large subunit-like protein